MDKTLESTLKTGLNNKSPTCDDKGVFTMMMAHTGNASSLRWARGWQEKGGGGGGCDMDLVSGFILGCLICE